MSASDSDSNNSWIMVDKEEEENVEEPVEEEHRETVEEVSDFWSQLGGEPPPPEEEEKPKEVTKETKEQKDGTEVVSYRNELMKYEPKPNQTSSLTSAGFMIIGLLIALYFRNGYEEDIITDIGYKQYSPVIPKDIIHESNQFKQSFKKQSKYDNIENDYKPYKSESYDKYSTKHKERYKEDKPKDIYKKKDFKIEYKKEKRYEEHDKKPYKNYDKKQKRDNSEEFYPQKKHFKKEAKYSKKKHSGERWRND